MRSGFFKIIYIALAAIIFNAACVSLQTSPVSGNKRVYGYSWEQELQIGAEADQEIIAQYGLYEDASLTSYVERLGHELVEVSHFNREDTPEQYLNTEFTFRVLNSPVVNAFALPGGYVYVTRGLLSHLENEAQLMVVLGHEIGHVAARHASQRAAEQQLGQLAIIGGAILGESLGFDGGNILQLSSQTAQLLFLSYSRDDERESDKLGVEYSAMDGYAAAEGGAFFTSLKRISEKAGHNIPSHLSSHPDPGEREQNIPRMASEWEARGYEMTKVDRVDFLEMIDGMMFGDNPREGFEKDGVFFHPDLGFRFPVPDAFTLYNEKSAVVLVNSSQDAIIQFTIDTDNRTAQSSVQAFLGQEGITVEDQFSVTLYGNEAYKGIATATTEGGTELKIELTAVEFEGAVYRFLSYTTLAQFEEYNNSFSEVTSGFNKVTDESVLNIKPVRIKLMRVENADSFSALLPDQLPMGIEPLDVAILNQVDINETIERGTLIKIPVQ